MKEQLQAGLARVNITPPLGTYLSGGNFGRSKGVIDNLYAASLILQNNKTCIVIITADLIGISRTCVENVRRDIEQKLGITGNNILIAASHTHSGPAAVFLRGWGKIDKKWIAGLQKKLVEVTAAAFSNLQDVLVGVGKGKIKSLTVNRRNPKGPIDPEIGVLQIEDLQHNPRAILVNFSCHPVTLHGYKNLISSDFAGYLRRTIQKAKGSKTTVLYANGAMGNINPAGFKGAGKGNMALARRMGRELGKKVLEISDSIHVSPHQDLKVNFQYIKLPLAPLPASAQLEEEIKRNTDIVQNKWTPVGRESKEYYQNLINWAKDALAFKEKKQCPPNLELELQAIQIGDAVLLAIPAEVYVEIGLALKAASPFKSTFIIGQANGAIGYLPTKEAFEKNFYEAGQAPRRYGIFSLRPEAGQVLKQAGLRLINGFPKYALAAGKMK